MSKLAYSGMQARDKWIPWYFVLFFAVIFAVNGVFVYFAITTNPGVVEKHTYEKGLKYNQRIKIVEKQVALGWKVKVDFKVSHSAAMPRVLEVVMVDAEGLALEGASVEAVLSRPLEAGSGVRVVCIEKAVGIYQATVTLSTLGQWEVDVMIKKGQDGFLLNKRIVLK